MPPSLPPALQNASVWLWAEPTTPEGAPHAPLIRQSDDLRRCDLVHMAADADEQTLTAAVARALPLVVTGCRSPSALGRLAARLAVAEATLGRSDGSTAVALLLGSPEGVLAAGLIAAASPRLFALGLDQMALASTLGASVDDQHAAPIHLARGQVVLAAAAAGIASVLRTGVSGASQSGPFAASDGFTVEILPAAQGIAVA